MARIRYLHAIPSDDRYSARTASIHLLEAAMNFDQHAISTTDADGNTRVDLSNGEPKHFYMADIKVHVRRDKNRDPEITTKIEAPNRLRAAIALAELIREGSTIEHD